MRGESRTAGRPTCASLICRAGRLGGWARWVVLAYALYYLIALFVPLVFGAEPNIVTETVWGLAWVVVGYTVRRAAQGEAVRALATTTS